MGRIVGGRIECNPVSQTYLQVGLWQWASAYARWGDTGRHPHGCPPFLRGDSIIATAILDRLLNHSTTISTPAEKSPDRRLELI
jgi:hypothetical protein